MSAVLLLPGMGGRYTFETFTSSSGIGADKIDCSKCDSLAFQIESSGSPTGNFDIQMSFNGTDWAVLEADVALTNGNILQFDPNDGPFGLIRIDATDITGGTVIVTLIGYPTRAGNI